MVKKELGLDRFDSEGRILQLEFPELVLINVYMPHGGRRKENMDYKLEAYSRLLQKLGKIKEKNVILIGDFNIAHTESDLARPKDNKNNTMFTPEERKQVDNLMEIGFVDTFRKFNNDNGHYTWWPYFANARARNLGWRLDYVFASMSMDKSLKDAFIFPEVMGSDHCPVGILV